MRRRLRLVSAVALGAECVLVGGCGEDETTFTAREFVEAANREGAGLELGKPLIALGESQEIYAATIEEAHEAKAEEDEGGHEHGGAASVVIAQDGEGAVAEFERCEGALSLTCFRAANVVVRVESDDSEQLARLGTAIQGIGEG